MSAVDILGNQTLLEQFSTVKISNFPIGKQITNLLSHVNHNLESGSILSPRFIKAFAKDQLVLLGFEYELHVWLFSEFGTELKSNHYCNSLIIDAILFQSGSRFNVVSLSSDDSVDSYLLNQFTLDNIVVNSMKQKGTATSISSTLNSLIIGHRDGAFRIVNTAKMEVVCEIKGYILPSKLQCKLSGMPPLLDASSRWIALEVGCKDDGWWERSVGSNLNDMHQASDTNPGDLMRKAVSGMYTVGKFSWESVEPYIDQALKGQQGENGANSNSKTDKRRQQQKNGKPPHTVAWRPSPGNDSNSNVSAERGGGVVIYDTGSDPTASLCKDMLRFSAHSTALSAIKFSPSGSKIATADDDGQVVHIHSIVMADGKEGGQSSLSVSLLYKLVRGITLVRVVDIQFNEFEDCCIVSTVRGTIHVFDLVGHSEVPGGGSAAFIRYPLPVAQPPVSAVIDSTSTQAVTKMGVDTNSQKIFPITSMQAADQQPTHVDNSPPALATIVNIDQVVRNNNDAKSVKLALEIPSDLRIRCPERSFKTSLTSIREKMEFDELHVFQCSDDKSCYGSPFGNSIGIATPDDSVLSNSQSEDLSQVPTAIGADPAATTFEDASLRFPEDEDNLVSHSCTLKTLLFNKVSKRDTVRSFQDSLLPMEYVVFVVTSDGLLCRQLFRRITSSSIGKSFELEGLPETNRWDLLLNKQSAPYVNMCSREAVRQQTSTSTVQTHHSVVSSSEGRVALPSTPERQLSTTYVSDSPSSVHNRNMKRAAWLTSACSSSGYKDAGGSAGGKGICDSNGFEITPLWQRHQIQLSIRNESSEKVEFEHTSSVLFANRLPKTSFHCKTDSTDGPVTGKNGHIQHRMSSVLGSGVGTGSQLHPSDSVDEANEVQRALFRKRNDEYKANRARQDDIGIWEMEAEWE